MSDTPTNMSEQTRRCEWCGEIAQGECGCAAETEIARLRDTEQQFLKVIRWGEALLAEKDAEIARLRKVLGWVAQNPEERAYWLGSVTALVAGGGKMSCSHREWHDCEICKQLDVKDAEIARLRDVLASKGFVECDIPACNCGWHHKYGLPERWAEIKEVLIDADALNNDTGNTPLNAIKKLISQLADKDAEIARLREDAERYRWLKSNYQEIKLPGRTLVPLTRHCMNSTIDAARKERE